MRIAIVYNEPVSSYYDAAGEQKAVTSVLSSVVAVQWSLLELGHSVVCLPLNIPLESVRRKLGRLRADLVFNLFEGFCGFPSTEPDIPAILSEIGLPYTGCPPDALKLALHKANSKTALKNGGIFTPDFQLLGTVNLSAFRLHYPCIVKPNCEDGSHGMNENSVVNNFPALEKQLTRIVRLYNGDEILVEEFINGREFNATVVGNTEIRALAVSEIAYSLSPKLPRILTYDSKWNPESAYYRGTPVVCPADIDEEQKQLITGVAEKAFVLTGCRGYARIDMRLDGEGRLNVIEVNPNPDISPDSGAVVQAKAAGLTYTGFIEKIVSLALEAK